LPVYLKILQGAGTGQVLPVPNAQPVTLGRSAGASYAFDDPLLSRRHCAVECRGTLVRIVDLQSRNGTFVNGQRVGAQLLNLGDRIKIGNLVIEVSPVGSAAPPARATFEGGRKPAITQGIRNCQVCNQPLQGAGQPLKGRILCNTCFDRYDVQEDLVDGFKVRERREVTSFGVSYLAHQQLMDRPVILKVIEVGPQTEENSLKRFMREAKTGGRLAHPNIVELYDVNEQDGLLYIVTEYIDGQNMAQILQTRQGSLPWQDVLHVMTQIAEALQYAHQQKIVHRDVKPANLLIRAKDQRAKLQGFTLAKNLERAGLSVITADGESLGTPYYMPPEQVRSAKSVDERSDVYSWGATAYHCFSGRLPQEARSYGEFIDKVFNEDPSPLRVDGLPKPVGDLIDQCLRREPKSRPQSMQVILDCLLPIIRQLPAR
jgi:hypothetical protein